VPVFMVSNVVGTNLELLQKFLNAVPPRNEWEFLKHKDPEVLIDKTYHVRDVGTVVGGTVVSGKIETGSEMLLCPDKNGDFIPVTITSLHTKRVPVNQVHAGQHVAFSLKDIQRSQTRKGMVLLSQDSKPQATWTFEAIVKVDVAPKIRYEPVIQCRTVRQSAKIISMNNEHPASPLKSSSGSISKSPSKSPSKASFLKHSTQYDCTIGFKLLYRPEYLQVGMRVILRGCCKGIGTITKVHLDLPKPSTEGDLVSMSNFIEEAPFEMEP